MPSRLHLGLGLALLVSRVAPRQRIRARTSRDLKARLDAFPRRGLPLRAPVTIRWNDHQVPFVSAEHDRDLAVGLGLVHAHLRLAQIEFMRRLAFGRLSEVIGPLALDLDRVVRTVDLTRPAAAIVAALPAETHVWLEGFAEGLNAYVEHLRELPEEFAILGVRPEPWTVHDLVGLSRLAGTDFSWRVWVRLLRLYGRPDWMKTWRRLMQDNAPPVPSFAGLPGSAAVASELILGALGRGGSNSVAVSAERSATGGALIASDPHLSLVLPNLWLIAGIRSPSFHAVGLMIPGVPVVSLGRNRHIAWGGTNLHAASSDLVDVTGLPETRLSVRRETIRVRWWRDLEFSVEETAHGPIVSDAPLLGSPSGRRLALTWVGHRPNDEITAMLAVNRARNWSEFIEALDQFAVPALTMVYADAGGRIGRAIAAHLPRRPPDAPLDLVVGPETAAHWKGIVTGRDLPSRLDPPEGFVASANDRPSEPTSVAVGYFFSRGDRVRRLSALLSQPGQTTMERLAGLQRDVLLPGALELRDRLLELFAGEGSRPATSALDALRAWNGGYEADSAGALAFELLVYHFLRELHGRSGLGLYAATWDPWALLLDDLAAAPPETTRAALARALPRVGRAFTGFKHWGNMHRLRLSHFLGMVPGTGRRFRFADLPADGSNETIMKTAYGFTAERHSARLGANARHISNLSDPDDNRFVLLGGQDGWLGSTTFLDQLELWRRGAYVTVPMREEAVCTAFRHAMTLAPRGTTGSAASPGGPSHAT